MLTVVELDCFPGGDDPALAQRRFEEAITLGQDAAAVLRGAGDRHHEAWALIGLGNALREVGCFEEAITTCQDAAAIYREAGDRHNEATALNSVELSRSAQRS